jgi:hypothetical protein
LTAPGKYPKLTIQSCTEEKTMKHAVIVGIVGLGALVPPAMAQDSGKTALWETTITTETYGPRDRAPARITTQVEKECVMANDKDADKLLGKPENVERLKGKCWESGSRQEPGKVQVKMTCADGTTAEAVSRTEPDGSRGFMLVFNVPQQGALSMTGVSKKISDTCDAAGPSK